MQRERVRDLMFILVVVAVLAMIVASLVEKSGACTTRGGELVVWGHGRVECRLSDGSAIPI